MQEKKKVSLYMGPAMFLLLLAIPIPGLETDVRAAVGTVVWMAVWWVGMPINPAITAFLPVAVNAIFSLVDMESLISSYAAELVFLLAGSNIIAIAWEVTGVDKRIAAFVLSWVGTSVRQQIAVWFLAATILSSVLPNTVVAAIMCSIAISMLKFAGQGDLKNGSVGPIIMLAIVWGANNGGMLTPLGGSMNLITVSYIEELTNSEFIYTDWVVQLFPFGLVVTIITLLFLFFIAKGQKTLPGSRQYFKNLYESMPPIRREEVLSLIAFIFAAALSFTRQLYQSFLPDLKPGFIFLIFGLLMFFIKDKEKKRILSWEDVEKNMMWGLFFLFAGGMALGQLVNGSGAAEKFAEAISNISFSNELFLIFIIVTFNVVLSDVINNTACAAVTIPIIIGIAEGLSLPVIQYVWIATVSYNISFTLPTSIRSIPIGYGLDPKYMFKWGIFISLIVIVLVTALSWVCVNYWPTFGVLS